MCYASLYILSRFFFVQTNTHIRPTICWCIYIYMYIYICIYIYMYNLFIVLICWSWDICRWFSPNIPTEIVVPRRLPNRPLMSPVTPRNDIHGPWSRADGPWCCAAGCPSDKISRSQKSSEHIRRYVYIYIHTLTLHVFNICLHSNVPLRSQHSNVGLRRGHSFLSESIGRNYRKSGGPAAV